MAEHTVKDEWYTTTEISKAEHTVKNEWYTTTEISKTDKSEKYIVYADIASLSTPIPREKVICKNVAVTDNSYLFLLMYSDTERVERIKNLKKLNFVEALKKAKNNFTERLYFKIWA